ncbi:MAG TPA: thiamine pyrophosphate-dependent enzyme [Spirochaetota bacterium]|nr:thiamine pyrophosphate-dependent enzyme [Spirochaetota bacterium]
MTQPFNIKDIATATVMSPGTSACAGCGAIESLKIIFNILGENTVIVNAAGCMTMLSIWPFTPFGGSWLYTSMASAPAGAQGIRNALDILIKRKKISSAMDMKVVVLAGDGSAYGMGLSAASAAMDRGLDFYYICYDNEGYGNTGHQESSATPHGARTATGMHGSGYTGNKKDLFAIWTANRPVYAATVTAAEPADLAHKVEKSMKLKGPKMFLTLAPCPTNWHFEPCETVNIAKLAVKTGIWPLKEYFEERIIHTKIPERIPVEEYLKTQGRYAHLFSPHRNEKVIAEIQDAVDSYWQNTRQHIK